MKTIGALEAETRFLELLESVGHGERITITKRGKPVAVLSPIEEKPPMIAKEAVERIRRLRVDLPPDLTIRQMIEEGRK